MGGRGSTSQRKLRFPVDTSRRYKDGILQYESASGWHDEAKRATRNVGDYKVFAERIDSSVPYTVYHIADTRTGKVYRHEATHYWSGNNALGKLVEELRGREN